MVEEMFRIVGYHLPADIAARPVKDLETLCSLLKVFSVEGLQKMTFCEVSSKAALLIMLSMYKKISTKGLYDKIFTKEDMEKQTYFNRVYKLQARMKLCYQ